MCGVPRKCICMGIMCLNMYILLIFTLDLQIWLPASMIRGTTPSFCRYARPGIVNLGSVLVSVRSKRMTDFFEMESDRTDWRMNLDRTDFRPMQNELGPIDLGPKPDVACQ